jgi:hypothetical protein
MSELASESGREPAIAEALARAVAEFRVRRVPLKPVLLVAAASVDRTAAVSVGWRARVLAALTDLAEAGVVTLSKATLDSDVPPLPKFVTRRAEPARSRAPVAAVVWHLELSWVDDLDRAGELGVAERRFLTAVNAWLPRRRGVVVPMRERSLEIFSDEKELERWVLGPLFGPGRLSVEELDCFPCWPPVEQTVLGDGDWLVIENYTTYVSVSRRAADLGFTGRIVWGSGNQVGTRLSALATTGATRPARCWYFGDVDAGGFRVARLAVARAAELGLGQVMPARGLYGLAVRHGIRREVGRGSGETVEWARCWLGGELGERAAEILRAGERIVQEHVGTEVLGETGLVDWFEADESLAGGRVEPA